MSIDFSFGSDIDQESIEEVSFGASFPLVLYGYGNQKLASKVDGFDAKGGFFIDSERLGADESEREELTKALTEAGWLKDVRTLNDGKEIEGLYKFDIEIAIIHTRKRWEAAHDGSTKTTFAPFPDGSEGFKIREKLVNEFGRVKGRIQLLVVIRGMEEYGPFVLTLAGISQFLMCDFKNGFIPNFIRTMINTANAKAQNGARFPWRTFYMHLSPSVDGNGKNVFEEVGSGKETSYICKPSIVGLPDTADAKAVDAAHTKYFVGKELIVKGGKFDEFYHTHLEWASAWKNFTGEAEDASDLHNGQLAQPAAENAADLIAEAGI